MVVGDFSTYLELESGKIRVEILQTSVYLYPRFDLSIVSSCRREEDKEE
jgi:hypothetical protein